MRSTPTLRRTNLSSLSLIKVEAMRPVKVPWPPVLSTGASGQKYAICGAIWLPVPPETTRADLSKYMVCERAPTPSEGSEEFWKVEGSKGNTYKVRRSAQSVWSCTCVGYGWRGSCKHIIQRKEKEV